MSDETKGRAVRWKLDENNELPYAVIEDTEMGHGVYEFPNRSARSKARALAIIARHNARLAEVDNG